MEQINLIKQRVREIENNLTQLQAELEYIQDDICEHNIVTNDNGAAVCEDCGALLGVYCEKAEDNIALIDEHGICIDCGGNHDCIP